VITLRVRLGHGKGADRYQCTRQTWEESTGEFLMGQGEDSDVGDTGGSDVAELSLGNSDTIICCVHCVHIGLSDDDVGDTGGSDVAELSLGNSDTIISCVHCVHIGLSDNDVGDTSGSDVAELSLGNSDTIICCVHCTSTAFCAFSLRIANLLCTSYGSSALCISTRR